jgi:hypothetical protein
LGFTGIVFLRNTNTMHMKTIIISLLLSLLLSTLAYANSATRQWQIIRQHRIVEGSFHQYYHGQVYIKKNNQRIVKVPLYALSKADIDFALSEYEYRSLLQNKEKESTFADTDKVNYSGLIIVPLTVAIVMLYFLIQSYRRKLMYFPPKIQRLM